MSDFMEPMASHADAYNTTEDVEMTAGHGHDIFQGQESGVHEQEMDDLFGNDEVEHASHSRSVPPQLHKSP